MKGTVLAIDYGKKRIGVASGHTETKMAFARSVVENKGIEWVISKLNSLCGELEVKMIIVGLPLNMDNVEEGNEMMSEVRYFVKELRESMPEMEVQMFDERLSSHEANQLLRDASNKIGKERHGKDAYAAQIILQRFFEKL